MLATTEERYDLHAPESASSTSQLRLAPIGPVDPLSEDRSTDKPIVTTERRLQRLAIVACDVGTRFAREGVNHDPVAWMLAPRTLFAGARALEACQDREAFLRATLLHGLALGLDADPDELDALVADDDEDESDADRDEIPCSLGGYEQGTRLYTCMIEGRFGIGGRHIQAFCAMVAADESVVRRRLNVRYGERLGEAAVVHDGFDDAGALARALLSPTVCRMLTAVAADPSGDLGSGLDLHVEQRFAA